MNYEDSPISQTLRDVVDDNYSQLRKPKKVVFFINGNLSYRGKIINITPNRYFIFDELLTDLTRFFIRYLPNGVRKLYNKDGEQINDLNQLEDESYYICSSSEPFKISNYEKRFILFTLRDHAHNHDLQYKIFVGPQQVTADGYILPEIPTYYRNHKSDHVHTPHRHSKSIKSLSRSSSIAESDETSSDQTLKKSRKLKPKLLTIIRRTETLPNSYFKILLNRNGGQSFPDLLSDMSEALGHKWRDNPITGLIAKDGIPANKMSDLFRNENMFVAIGERDPVPDSEEIEKIIADTFPNDEPDNATRSNDKLSEEDNMNGNSSTLTAVQEEDLDTDEFDDEPQKNSGTEKKKIDPKSQRYKRNGIPYNKTRHPEPPETLRRLRLPKAGSNDNLEVSQEYPLNDSRKPGAFNMQPERPTEKVLAPRIRAHIYRYERIMASQRERARARMMMARKIEKENRELESFRDLPRDNNRPNKMYQGYPIFDRIKKQDNSPYNQSMKAAPYSRVPRNNITNRPGYPRGQNRGRSIPYMSGMGEPSGETRKKRNYPRNTTDRRDSDWNPPNHDGLYNPRKYQSYPNTRRDPARKVSNQRPQKEANMYRPYDEDRDDRLRNMRPLRNGVQYGKEPNNGTNIPLNTNRNYRLPNHQSYPDDSPYRTRPSYRKPIERSRDGGSWNNRDYPEEKDQSRGGRPWKEYPPYSNNDPHTRMNGDHDLPVEDGKSDKPRRPRVLQYNRPNPESEYDKDNNGMPPSSDEEQQFFVTKRRPEDKRPVGTSSRSSQKPVANKVDQLDDDNQEQWARIPPIDFSSKPRKETEQNRYRAPQTVNMPTLGTVAEEDGERKLQNKEPNGKALQVEDKRTDTRSLSSLIGPRGDTVKISDTNKPLQKPVRTSRQSMIVQNPKSDRIVPKLASQLPNEESFNDIFNVGQLLATGNFSEVKEARKKKDGLPYAVKIIDKPKLKDKEDLVEEEIRILMSCNHPNIMELKEQYESPGKVFLVTELVKEGDLFDAICENIKFTEPQAAVMMRDLGRALFYLHSRGIVHRDIKPENLLVIKTNGVMNLKLADFGLAIEAKESLFVICGTATYVAPEILNDQGYGLEVDIWAAGVVAYILLCGFPPFRSTDRKQTELFEFIKAGEFDYLSPYWDNISTDARDLIDHMIVTKPRERYTAMDVLCHPWILTLGNSIRFNTPIEEISSHARLEFKVEADTYRDDYRRIRDLEY